jgi:hypothetical protein
MVSLRWPLVGFVEFAIAGPQTVEKGRGVVRAPRLSSPDGTYQLGMVLWRGDNYPVSSPSLTQQRPTLGPCRSTRASTRHGISSAARWPFPRLPVAAMLHRDG